MANKSKTKAPIRYMQKPLLITAMQFTYPAKDALIDWLGAAYVGEKFFRHDDGIDRKLMIRSKNPLDRFIEVSQNDYVVKRDDNVFYAINQSDFEKTHMPLADFENKVNLSFQHA